MIMLFLADGFEEIEALTAVDLLRRAGAEVVTVGVTGKTVTGSHGIEVRADVTAKEAAKRLAAGEVPEMVVLPGGMPGSVNLDASPVVDAYLRAATEADSFICAICAAPFVLGRRGLLRGCRATCYPGFEKDLLGAAVEDAGVVIDGKRITGRAMGSATEFALALVAAVCGNETAEKIRKSIIA